MIFYKLLLLFLFVLIRCVGVLKFFKTVIAAFVFGVYSLSGPDSITTRIWTSGTMVLCIAIVLLVVLGIILI